MIRGHQPHIACNSHTWNMETWSFAGKCDFTRISLSEYTIILVNLILNGFRNLEVEQKQTFLMGS